MKPERQTRGERREKTMMPPNKSTVAKEAGRPAIKAVRPEEKSSRAGKMEGKPEEKGAPGLCRIRLKVPL